MRLSILSSVSLLVLAVTAPAFAGFEFVAPSGSSASSAAPANNNQDLTPVAPVVPPAPIISDNLPEPVPAPTRIQNARSETPIAPIDVPLTPVITDSDALSVENGSYNSKPAFTPPAMPAPMRNIVDNLAPTARMPEPASASIGNDSAVVQGFGRNVPLAIALQQIVPASYRYSFEDSVNPSMKIAWTGGKPWKQIIADIARTNNMNVQISSNVVSFSHQSPMDMIASGSVVDSSPDTVLGMKLKSLPGQRIAAPVASAPVYDAPMDQPAPVPSSRTQLAAVSDMPPPVMPLNDPAPAAPAEKSAFFDNMMDNGSNSGSAAPEKKIMTANNKPVDILDRISVASPSPAQTTNSSAPKPVESVPIPPAPLPAAPSNAPINITRQIDNTPVMSNDLPAPSAMPAPVDQPISTSKAGLSEMQEWVAHKGQTLRQTLTSWSQQAGVSLVWSSEYDYPLQTDVRIQANYADTVRTLLAGFSKAQPRPIGRLFKNDKVGAQPVLIVETQRLTN